MMGNWARVGLSIRITPGERAMDEQAHRRMTLRLSVLSLILSLTVAVVSAYWNFSAEPQIQGTFTPKVSTWVGSPSYYVSVALGIYNAGRRETMIDNMWLEVDPCVPRCGSPHSLEVFDIEQRHITREGNSEKITWDSLSNFSPFGIAPGASHTGTYSFVSSSHEWVPKGHANVNNAEVCLWVSSVHKQRQKLACRKFSIGQYPTDSGRLFWYENENVPGGNSPTGI
jgi:hypothetical protein